jgi:hypothetical protein
MRPHLLDAKAAFETLFDDAFEECSDRPPVGALRRMRLHVLDGLDGFAHDARGFLVAIQPGEQAALVLPALLDQERR